MRMKMVMMGKPVPCVICEHEIPAMVRHEMHFHVVVAMERKAEIFVGFAPIAGKAPHMCVLPGKVVVEPRHHPLREVRRLRAEHHCPKCAKKIKAHVRMMHAMI